MCQFFPDRFDSDRFKTHITKTAGDAVRHRKEGKAESPIGNKDSAARFANFLEIKNILVERSQLSRILGVDR